MSLTLKDPHSRLFMRHVESGIAVLL